MIILLRLAVVLYFIVALPLLAVGIIIELILRTILLLLLNSIGYVITGKTYNTIEGNATENAWLFVEYIFYPIRIILERIKEMEGKNNG